MFQPLRFDHRYVRGDELHPGEAQSPEQRRTGPAERCRLRGGEECRPRCAHLPLSRHRSGHRGDVPHHPLHEDAEERRPESRHPYYDHPAPSRHPETLS